jgi:biopolymer transport protein ExbB
MERLMRLIKEKMIREAIALCDESKSPLALTVKAGITKSEKGREEIERAMEEASRGVISELERYLNGLAIIAHVSPLLGLLGTVTGMIKAFMKVEQAGGNVNVGVLAGGIWEALITTASGLVVAIPMIVAHHYLTGKVNSISQDLEIQAAQVVEGLTSEERRKEG